MFVITHSKTGEYWSLTEGWSDHCDRSFFDNDQVVLPRFGEFHEEKQEPGFYVLRQNVCPEKKKSVFDPVRGIGRIVIIEARNSSECIKRAEEIGLVFGWQEGDCEQCPHRWIQPDCDPTEMQYLSINYMPPRISDATPKEHGYSGFIHKLDGTISYFQN